MVIILNFGAFEAGLTQKAVFDSVLLKTEDTEVELKCTFGITMQSRVVPLEEGEEVTPINRTNQSKLSTLRPIRVLVLFLVLCIAFSIVSIHTIRYFGINSVVTTAKSSTFRPCYEEPRSLEQWITPPSNLMHNMTDTELLWRASLVPRIKKYPFQRVRKIAFMFLTKGPLPLAPIWERFLKGHEGFYSIYVHSLPSFQANFPPSSVFYRRQIPSQVSIFMLNFLVMRLHGKILHLVPDSCIFVFISVFYRMILFGCTMFVLIYRQFLH